MGKKVYNPYQGGWNDPSLNENYQKAIIKPNMSRGSQRLIAPTIARKKVLDAEEQAFLEQIRKEQEYERLLKEEEARLQAAKRLSKLNQTEKSVVNQLAAKKKVNIDDPNALNDKDINEYIESVEKYKAIKDVDPFLTAKEKAAKKAEQEEGFFNAENWKANFDWFKNAFQTSANNAGRALGVNSKQNPELDKAEATKRRYEIPIAKQTLAQIEKQIKDIEDTRIGYDYDRDKEVRERFSMGDMGERAALSSSITLEDNDARGRQTSALKKLQTDRKNLKDFIEGKDGILSGAASLTPDLLSAGLSSTLDSANLTKAFLKSKNGEKLDLQDEQLLKAHALSQQVQGMDLNKDRFWYRTGQGAAHSAVFMEQAVLTAPIGGVAGKVISKAVSPLAEKVAFNLMTKSLGFAERKAADKAIRLLADKGVGIVEKGMIGTGELLTQALVVPNTYTGATGKFIGQTQFVTDSEGNEKVLVTASQRKAFEKESRARLAQINAREQEIKKKGELTEADNDELLKLQQERDQVSEQMSSIYDPNTGNIYEDVGGKDALIYGYTETLKELGAERYVGGAIQKVTGLGSKFNTAIGGSKVGGAYNKVSKMLEPVSNAISKGNQVLNNLGKLSSNLGAHTGTSKLFHGIPGEVAEEIAVQLTPTYMEDYSKQLEELTDPMFYVDVIAQTLLMGGAPTAIGATKHLSKYATDKNYRKEYRQNRDLKNEVRDIYRNIDKAVNDDELAQHIAMRSGNTLFDMNSYQARINELRTGTDKIAPNPKEANELEGRSFFNLATNAMRTGTMEEFERTLAKVARNKNLTEETRQNATMFIPKLQEMKKIQEAHAGKVNYHEILNGSINNMLFNDTIAKLDKDMSEHREEAERFINQSKEVGVLPEDFTFDFDFKNTIESDSDVNNTLATLMEQSPSLMRMMELQYTKDIYTEAAYQNTKELNYELNPANQEAILTRHKERLQELLVQSANGDNAEANKEAVVENDINVVNEKGESTLNEIDKKAYEDKLDNKGIVEQPPVNEDDTEETPDAEELTKLNTNPQLLDAFKSLLPQAENKEVENEVEDEEDSPFNAPMELNDKDRDDQIINPLVEAFKASPNATLKGAIAVFGNEDIFKAERLYNHIVEAYNRANPSKAIDNNEKVRIYNETFGNQQALADAFNKTSLQQVGLVPGNISTTGPVTPVTVGTVNQEEVESSGNESVGINPVTKQPAVLYKGHKITTPTVKLAYIGQFINISEDGTQYENASNEVNPQAMPALHFENFKVGSKVKLDFNWDYFNTESQITTYVQHNDGSVDVVVKDIKDFVENIFGKGFYPQFLSKMNTPEGRQELLSNETFLGSIPTKTTLDNGLQTDLGINSIDWWNTKNVALETNEKGEYLVERQRQVIEEAKKRNFRLRQSLAKGNLVELTVENKSEGFHNKQLLTEEEKQEAIDNGTPPTSKKFQSVIDSFGGNKEAALKTVGLGAMIGQAPASTINSDKKITLKVGNKDVVLTNENSNITEFKKSMAKSTGSSNGRPFMVYQNGFNSKGEPNYIIRGLITDHASKAQDFNNQFNMLAHLDKMGKIAAGTVPSTPNQIEKAKKIYDYFKKKYNIDITDWKQLSNNLREYYPKLKTNKTDANRFHQDYKVGTKHNPTIPDVRGFDSVAQFESAILGGTLPETTANEVFMSNVHTQYIFSEISDGIHEPVWTTEVQSNIQFSDDYTEQETAEERKAELEAKVAQLQHNEEIKNDLERQIAETDDKLKKRSLEREKAKIEAEEVQIVNEIVSEGLDVEEVKKKQPSVTEPTPERKFDDSDLDTINQHVMYNALKRINTKDFTRQYLYEKVLQELDSMIERYEKSGKTKEADFLKNNRDSILGVNSYDGSVLEMIDTLFDLNQGEALDFTSLFVKDQNKESSEVDITTSLSLRVKMLLSGIADPRANTKDNFAGIPEYFTFKDTMDFLQQALSEIHNNSLEDLEKWIKAKVSQNPREFIFYNQILKRLKALKNTDDAFLNEILYFLHQPKVDMTFLMYNENESGTFTVQKYDANAKNPNIAKRSKWSENLKTSPLIEIYEDNYYRINQEELQKVTDLYNSIVADRDAGRTINYDDLSKYFSYFGIRLNFNTLKALDEGRFNDNDYRIYHAEPGQNAKGILASNQIFERLYKNITEANGKATMFNFKLTLNKNAAVEKSDLFLNPLTTNNSSALKRLIDADNMMSAYNLNSMRIAGKSINPFQQSKSLTNTISKIKNDPEFIKKLKETPITSNSFFLEILEQYPEMKESFNLNTLSLEALKKSNTASREDMGPTQLSDMDSLVTLFNLFAQNDGKVTSSYNGDDTIKIRKGSMIFPTLSDSSQQPILNTFLINLQRSNFDDVDLTTLSDNVIAILVDKMIKNELNRVAAFINSKESTNIKGHDAGAQFINTYISTNSVLVETTEIVNGKTVDIKLPLIEVFKHKSDGGGTPWTENVEGFIETYKDVIYNEVRENLEVEVNKTIDNFTTEGLYDASLVEQGLPAEIKHIDNEYLTSKGDMSPESKMRLIAYDYVLNSAITLNEMHNLFAGDTANYFKDKHVKDFEFGLPKVGFFDLAEYYYGQEAPLEYFQKVYENLSDPEVLKNVQDNYPKLLSSTEMPTNSLNQRIEDINPIARLKMVDIYKDVQNNLSKRLKELISPGSQYPNSMDKDQVYYQIMLQDIENSSEVLHSLARRFHPDKAEEYSAKIDKFKELDDIYESNRNEVQAKQHSALMKELSKALPQIKSFLKNATTDAQEYSTWQDNLNLLRNQGRVTEEEFNAIFDRLTAQAKDIDEVGYIREENKWKDSEQDLRAKSVMQVTKPLYSGHHLETTPNGYNHSRYIYIKSSSFALTPELTVGFPKLNAMRKNMEKWQEIDPNTRKITSTIRASYDSANKVGAVKTGLPITELYKDNPDLGLIGSNTVELDKSNFFIQQDKPFKGDKKSAKPMQTTRATQFEKILLGDGINKIEEFVFPNLFDRSLLNDLGIEDKDNMLNGPQLKQIYDAIYEREQKLLADKFNRELGITDINDIANGNPVVLEKLIDKLKARLTNKQDLKALELEYRVKVNGKNKTMSKAELNEAQKDENSEVEVIRANFKLPLYMMPNSNKFESVLNSIINKSNVNLKLPGFASPVGSQEGFDYKGYSEEEFKKAQKAGLITTKNFDPSKGLQATRDENGELRYAQVFIANKFKVLNKETGLYEFIDLRQYVDENNQIDTSKLPEELLSMFSFRIPTSSHQSGVIIEIAGFLPHTSADLMIVPKDHTTQIGEDYDIDMRYVYQYNYIKDLDGNLKKLDYSDIEKVEGSYDEIYQRFTSAKEKLFEEYFRYTVDQKDVTSRRNNKINNDYWRSNRETLIEIAFLREALDHSSIQDSSINNLVHSLFDEDMLPEDTGLTPNEIKEKIKQLEERLFTAEQLKERGRELREELKEKVSSLREAFQDENSEFRKAITLYNNVLGQKGNEQKVLENNLVGLYKTVFSSNDDRVQQLINKTLSTDSANDTATEMDKISNRDKSPYYTFNSPSLQREVVKLGTSGQIGIGEHSNAVTMNSIFQQSEFTHQIFKDYDEETGEIIPYDIQLGKFRFDGVMGKIQVNGVRVSELAMEDQNSATDNQKLQIMGRRNEDKNTMGVLKILHASGLDKDLIKVVRASDGEDVELSYASLFINQPIIREYSKLVNSLSSATNSSKGNPKSVAAKQLLDELIDKLPQNVWVVDEKTGAPVVGVLRDNLKRSIGLSLTSGRLYNELLESDNLTQFVVLKNFLELQQASSTYNELQRVVNVEKNGMGISYFDTISSMETLLSTLNGETLITNSAPMIGEFEIASTSKEIDDLKSKGYIPLITKDSNISVKSSLYSNMLEGQTVLVKPTNHFSHKIVTSIALGYNTYNFLFPYNNNNIDFAIEKILRNLNISSNSAEGQQQRYKIVADLKDYIYTNNQTLFGDVDSARKELFFDDKAENKESLATYLLKLSQNKEFEDLFRKPFFRDLSYSINDKSFPSMISFNNSDISKVNTLSIYNNFSKMMNTNKKLPTFNGRTYNYKALMKDLLKYSLLADQGNGAIGFRQHLPIELFDKYGVTKGVNKTTNINSNYQSIAYHGTTKTLENVLGGHINDFGEIEITNPTLTKAKINSLVNNVNKIYMADFGIENAVYYNAASNKVVLSETDGKRVKSNFVRQYIQHNPKLVSFVAGSQLGKILKDNGYNQEDFAKNRVKEFYFKTTLDFIVLKDEKGKMFLYEQVADSFFREIPILGTFGMKEYNVRKEQVESSINKNNPIVAPKAIVPVDKSQIPSAMSIENPNDSTDLIGSNLNKVTAIISSENPQGAYRPLFQFFKEYVSFENVQVVKGPATNDYKARYYPSGKIEINPSLLGENFDIEEISKIVAEEMIHHVTVNLVGQYIEFTGIDPVTGQISYKPVEVNGFPVTVPAEIHSLVAVYNFALKKMADKHGLDNILATIRNSNSHIGATQDAGNDLYRVSNIHEFLAGIFMKDENFAKEMAETPYRQSDKSVAEKFFDVLMRLFHRMIPSLKKETVSGEVAVSLGELMRAHASGTNGKYKPKKVEVVYDTPEKRSKFAESLRLIEQANIQMNRENLLDDTDDLLDFEDNDSLNSPVNISNFAEEAIKCK